MGAFSTLWAPMVASLGTVEQRMKQVPSPDGACQSRAPWPS